MKENLIDKYMAGTSSHEEEQQLLALLQAESTLSPEDQMLLDMLRMNTHEVEMQDSWLEEDESKLFDSLMETPDNKVVTEDKELQQSVTTHKRPPRQLRVIAIRILATAAVLTGAFYAARPLWNNSSKDMTVTYIYGNKIEDSQVAMNMMQETLGDIFDRPDVESELTDLLN